MDATVRICAAVNRVRCANPIQCCEEIEQLLENTPLADITVLPALALCSPSCGSLFKSRQLVADCAEALQRLIVRSAQRGGYLIVGLPVVDCGRTVPALAVICKGQLLGLLPDSGVYAGLSNAFSTQFLPTSTVFQSGALRFCVTGGDDKTLLSRAALLSNSGVGLIVSASYSPVRAGTSQRFYETVRLLSEQYQIAVAAVRGGVGDTSHPQLYVGMTCICECGETLLLSDGETYGVGFSHCCDLDCDILAACNATNGCIPTAGFAEPLEKEDLLRPVRRQPFVPQDEEGRTLFLDELFALQVRSLATRLENTGMRHAVLGVSGGLDSTLALLVAACAFDKLSIPRSNLTCVTMPGFGTSDRTYYNALGLMETLGVELRDIPIRAAVIQHFEDIGHDPACRDVTYENAQARERTQILLDLANELGAVVIGTGDLSEAALGWCTFGGDALAGYNVNICLPKTIVRMVVERLAEQAQIPGTEDYLLDVLSTPVSPELLPAAQNGEIAQKTEDLLGPYALHDFFIYHFVRYAFSPQKLYDYALVAFEEDYSPEEIKSCLVTFIRRIYTTQFKRSCAPDCAAIAPVTLTALDWSIPCDLDRAHWVEEAENVLL